MGLYDIGGHRLIIIMASATAWVAPSVWTAALVPPITGVVVSRTLAASGVSMAVAASEAVATAKAD
jgi:hypothetical protein